MSKIKLIFLTLIALFLFGCVLHQFKREPKDESYFHTVNPYMPNE